MNNTLSNQPQVLLRSAPPFAVLLTCALPLLVIVTRDGMHGALFVMLLSLAWLGRARWRAFIDDHGRAVAGIAFGFGGYFLVSLVRLVVYRQNLHTLDGPLRLLLALACLVFVAGYRPPVRAFWLGLCLGAVSAGVIAVLQWTSSGGERAEGFTHHAITFGDLAAAMGVMSLCALGQLGTRRLALLPVLAFVCGLVAAVLSGSRGTWLGLLLVIPFLLNYGSAVHGRRLVYGVLLALALSVAAWFVPATGIAQRVHLAVSEVQQYQSAGNASTSVGIRLELWKASWMMITEHPWLGVGREEFHPALLALRAQGRLQQSDALLYSSSHFDLFNVLATGGLLDFSLLLVMYGAPLHFFLSRLRRPGASAGGRAVALAGLALVVCFFGFGQTDVMFWLMMPKVFYGIMVCILAGFCLNDEDVRASRAACA
jgi:O-antigen ligase